MYSTAHPVLQPHAPYSQCQGSYDESRSAALPPLVLVLYYCMYLTHTPSLLGVSLV